jgi:polar amino acid transport system substrate-binding protein
MLSGATAPMISEDQREDFPRRPDTSLGCGRAWRCWFHAAIVLVLGLGWGTLASAEPIAASTASVRPLLRVITGYSSPFVKPPGTPVSGFSIEVWNEVARRIGVDTAWTVLPDLSDEAQLVAVVEGRADLAISALALTAEREARVDFSVPYFDSGLQILVSNRAESPLWTTLRSLVSPAMLELFGVGLGVVFALANILWLVERKHNPAFRRGYASSILEGLWGVMLIIATGEHGDRDTPRALKRFVVSVMWLFGVVLIAQFTATVTSTLTIQQIQSSIQGPGDLPGKTIATAPGTVAAAWLTSMGLPFMPLTDSEQAYGMLIRGEIQAIVYEAPQLQYWIATRGPSMASLVGPVFRPAKYAIAVPIGSQLRKRINEALLNMQADGSAEEIERRWFARNR